MKWIQVRKNGCYGDYVLKDDIAKEMMRNPHTLVESTKNMFRLLRTHVHQLENMNTVKTGYVLKHELAQLCNELIQWKRIDTIDANRSGYNSGYNSGNNSSNGMKRSDSQADGFVWDRSTEVASLLPSSSLSITTDTADTATSLCHNPAHMSPPRAVSPALLRSSSCTSVTSVTSVTNVTGVTNVKHWLHYIGVTSRKH